MNSDKQPAPGPTIKRSDGKWTFYVFPDGHQQEAGQYDSESAAKDARFKVLLQWGSNGKKYAPVNVS
jgi:hypothetical protein